MYIYVINCFVATIFLHQPQRPLERFGIDTSIDQKWMQKIWLEVDIMEILVWIRCFSPWLRSTLGQFFPAWLPTARNLQGMLLCQLGCVQLPGVWGTQKNRMEEGMGVLRGFKGMMGDGFIPPLLLYILCLFFSSDIGHHPKSLSMYILHRVSMWALMWTLRCIWCSLVSSSIILYRYIMLAMLQCMQQTSCRLRHFIHPRLWYLFADNLAASSYHPKVCFFLYPWYRYLWQTSCFLLSSFCFRNEQLNIQWSIKGNFLKFDYARQWICAKFLYLVGGFKHFLFLPRTLGKWSNSDEQIVQLGWFNHHLIILVFIIVYTLPPRIMEVKIWVYLH